MLKKLDKFILSRFLGPFFLAYAVVTFIFLIQHLLRYFKHFVGKDLGWGVFFELFSNFALMLTPVALPLAVLLSSLMSFGSLGQHSELTAIKSSGVSLLRILRPVGAFVLLATTGAVYFNDVISPEANLYAYSLLYDIKQKKPTLDFKEGAFYDGLPGYSIRVEKKSGQDGQELEGLMIYNHTAKQGDTDLIMAERGRMYTINNGDYLVLEMINGSRYTDMSAERGRKHEREFLTNDFDSSKIVFSMESFGLKETKKELFKGHNMMKTANQLINEWDSVEVLMADITKTVSTKSKAYYYYQFPEEEDELLASVRKLQEDEEVKKGGRPIDTKPPSNTDSKGTTSPPPSVTQPKAREHTDPLLATRKKIWDEIELSTPKNQENPLEPLFGRKGLPPEQSLMERVNSLKDLSPQIQEDKRVAVTLEQETPLKKTLTLNEEDPGPAIEEPILSPEERKFEAARNRLAQQANQNEKPNNTLVKPNVVSTQKLQKKLQESPLAVNDDKPKIKPQENVRQLRASQAYKAQKSISKPDTQDDEAVDKIPEDEDNLSREEVQKRAQKTQEIKPKPKEWHEEMNYRTLNMAWSKANGVKISLEDIERRMERYEKYIVEYELELQNKYARAMAVFIMFLIGAPLGAIIKKGGLGVPILISIVFFIIYYVTTLSGSKLAKNQAISVELGAWGGDALLLLCGLFFLKQAYQDSRILDFDYYSVMFEKAKSLFVKKKGVEG